MTIATGIESKIKVQRKKELWDVRKIMKLNQLKNVERVPQHNRQQKNKLLYDIS